MLLGAGVPVAWKLIPAATPPVYADPSNEHARRGAFATKQLWVTPHSDDERWPAGDCLNASLLHPSTYLGALLLEGLLKVCTGVVCKTSSRGLRQHA